MKKMVVFFFVLLVFFLFCAGKADSRVIKLWWDANTEPDLAGYRVYWGTDSAAVWGKNTASPNVQVVDRGLLTCACITVDDTLANAFYFAVTAYDTSGNESATAQNGSALPYDLFGNIAGGDFNSGTPANLAIVNWQDRAALGTCFGQAVTANNTVDCNTCAGTRQLSTTCQQADFLGKGRVDGFSLIYLNWRDQNTPQ